MRNVFTIIDELSSGLGELKRALEPLAAFASSNGGGPRQVRRRTRGRRRAATTTTKAKSPAKPKKVSRKTKKPVSPKVRAMRIHQGKYLAALRNLTAQQRAQVKKAKAEGDYGAALKLAASFQRKSA